MKNNKMYHVKSFFAVLLVFLLVMESISPIPQVIAADKKTAKKEETKLPKDEAVFTGNLAEGFDDEALAAMEADSYAMPWEEEAETSTAQPKKKQAVRAQAEEDVTDRVTKKLKFFINGKEVTSGSQFEVVPGSNFSYEFEWSIDDSPSEGQDRPSLDDNSYFEVTLFTVKGLLIPDQKDQPAVINYNGRNVRIGTWSLTYHDENPKGEDDSGSCVFRMDFSKYAGAFKEIGGYKKGSGKFSSNLTGDETITVGDKTGIITFLPPSANPNLPGVSPAPVGKGWTLSKPPILYKDYDFGKGYKWSTQDPNAALKQIEYRAVYLKELQEYQKRLLEKNEDILNEDGTIKDGEEINIDFLEPSEYNYIIEDTLDVNQEFSYLMNDKKYSKDVPFYFEIPIMAAGTGSFLNARSGGVGNNEYDGNGGDFNEDYISGSKFLKLEKEDAVRATPMSWTVVNVKGQDGQKRQKLIVNIGQLGTTEKEKFTQSNIKNPKFKDTITKYIDSAKENITSLEKGNNSPAVMLKTDTAQLETICAGAGISNEDCETVKAKVEEFNRWYNTYFSDKAFVLQNLTDDAKNAFSELTLYSYLQELENNANYPNLKQKQAYQDWKKAYSALPENQNFYSEKREEYLKSWKDALMRYQMTEAFYGKGQIYGFVMKYASKVKNTSVGVYRNDIRISTGGVSYDAEDEIKLTFSHGISGVFSGGDAVFQKADSGYQSLNNVGENGIAGAGFQVYCGVREGNSWKFVESDEHLGVFMEKGASASGNAYVWSHNLKNNDDEAIDPIDDITTDTVYTDENGKLVLNGLKDSEVHFLVETEAPEGYYLDTTPIQFQTNENTVIYKMIPNISRAVRLTKASSYDNEPVEGAEFVLYDNNNKPITGFTKTSLKIKDGAETTYYKYDVKGKAQLKTFANGQLNIHGLPAGDYYLQEKSPAPGFVMPENPPKYKFTLADEMTDKLKGNLYEENGFYYVLANPSADNKPKDVFNDEAVKSVMITKVGKESKPISGAAFKLQRFKGTEEEWKAQQSPAASKYQDVKVNEKDSVYFKTKAKEEAKGGYEVDANGRLTFTDLPSGHYALKETKAPEDYELARNLWYFDVDVLNKDEVQISWNPDGKEPIEGNKIPNEFNNGTLKLHKIVSGTGGNTERKFNFDISLKDRYGDNYKGWLNYTISRQSEGGNEVEVESKRINMDEKYGGKLSLLLKHEQTLTITGISGGASYKIVEENLKLDGYNPNIDKPSGTIPNGQTVEVTARNRYMTGMLRLTKEVGGINGDKTNPFEFTLRFEDIWHGEVPWNGKRTFTVLRTEDDNQEEPKVETLEVIGGFANVKLKSGQSITIAGLPDGTMYEITETAVDDYITKVSLNANKIGEDGSDDVSTDKTLTVEDNKIGNLIEDNCRDNVLFTNTRVPDEGSLMITKYVDCLLGHHEQEFDFKVTLKDTNEKPISGIYKAKIGRYTDKDSNLKEEKPDVEEIGIEFNENGEAFFKLKHQEYLMFTNLPEDSHYKVEEIPADGYEISMGEAAEGKIKENSADTPPILVTVNNFHKEGNLKVSKLVSGRGADLQKEFDFKLTLTDAEGKPFGGTFPYAKTDMVQNSEQNTLAEEPEESVNTIIINEDGTADFKLKDGQEIKISGLPDGTNYQVEEVTTDDKYKVTVTDGSGTIQSNGTANVRFVNTYKTGQLNVKKVVANGETDKKFHFKVKLDDETISGTYNEMEFKNGIAEFDLAHNEIKIASNLPVDIKYTVTEDSYAGYAVTYTGETGTISDTSHSEAVITNTQISSNPPDNPPTPPGDNPPTPPGGDPPTPPGGNPPNPPGENPPNPPGETPPTSPGDNPTTSPGNPTTPPAKEPQLKPPKEPSVNQNSPKDTESKSPEVLRQKLKSVKAAINRIKTGDVTNPWPPLVLMIISLCCIVAVLMRKWKRK